MRNGCLTRVPRDASLALLAVLALNGAALAQSATAPADAFLSEVTALCGQAFEGRVVADVPAQPGPDAFAGQRLVMHVRECGEREVRIPFHVGTDRSRTWVVTRTAEGLRLKHDHRHADGTADALTNYGGDSRAPGTATRQEFPADRESIELFEREGRHVSIENTWVLEVEPGRRFVYALTRPNGRRFEVEFDLSRPVEPPPAPWGAR